MQPSITSEALANDSALPRSARPDARPGAPVGQVFGGLLAGPIIPALLKLAAPTVVVLAVQTLVSVAETYFVGFLGTDAIAGVALVFPLLMLMTMMSNGGIGGGVSSAVARALGAGRRHDADALVWHAVVVAIVFGALFTLGALAGGPRALQALGGEGESLAKAALHYSDLVFGAAVPIWITNLLASRAARSGQGQSPRACSPRPAQCSRSRCRRR